MLKHWQLVLHDSTKTTLKTTATQYFPKKNSTLFFGYHSTCRPPNSVQLTPTTLMICHHLALTTFPPSPPPPRGHSHQFRPVLKASCSPTSHTRSSLHMSYTGRPLHNPPPFISTLAIVCLSKAFTQHCTQKPSLIFLYLIILTCPLLRIPPPHLHHSGYESLVKPIFYPLETVRPLYPSGSHLDKPASSPCSLQEYALPPPSC